MNGFSSLPQHLMLVKTSVKNILILETSFDKSVPKNKGNQSIVSRQQSLSISDDALLR